MSCCKSLKKSCCTSAILESLEAEQDGASGLSCAVRPETAMKTS